MQVKEVEVNRQLGDYVVVRIEYTPEHGRYAVRMAGGAEHISFHRDVTDAVHAILRYQKGDKRRSKH